ncbi:MAG: hypothetical protein OXH19_13200 [Chloroflexi bacterium]|nr:hypothetical protein [Chloroflexota bacterium]MCY3588620.1 hypothetical protein [Chloroflexota bacterium]MCY3684568.1 hypothetical protein [Chloroflexota bacterium]MDE2710106.1 hypothetical protein [Chloroflexota bacterium]
MENVKQPSTRGRYVGPSAARIGELIAPAQRVRFERGWFWTAALCHESDQDQLAFRQRPDGDGIDVRCKSAGCPREEIIRSLEQAAGESIWSAYTTEPRPSAARQPQVGETDGPDRTGRTGGRSWRLALAPFAVLLLAAPLVFGHGLEVAALNAFGLGWAGWLGHRVLVNRGRTAAKGGRAR